MFYKIIDNSVKSLEPDRKLIWQLRKLKEGQGSIKRIDWEIDALQFLLLAGQTKSRGSQTTRFGFEINEYPSHDFFSSEACNYFQERLEETTNLYLIIRYNQVLWRGNKSHKREWQAKTIVDTSLSLILTVNEDKEEEKYWELYKLLINAIEISCQVKKYKLDKLIIELRRLLINNEGTSDYMKINILDFIANSKKTFEVNDLSGVLVVANLIFDNLLVDSNVIFLDQLIHSIEKLVSKMNLRNIKHWYRRSGEVYEKFAHSRLDDTSYMIPLSSLMRAITYFDLAGDEEKVEELGVRYEEWSKKLSLQRLQIPLDQEATKALLEFIDLVVKKLIVLPPEQIFRFLSTEKYFIPTFSLFQNTMDIEGKNLRFLDFMTKIQFDINGNISKIGLPDKDDSFNEILSLFYGICTARFLSQMFYEGVVNQKITYDTLADFLRRYTWIGYRLVEKDKEERERYYSWLGLIGPALLEFFVQYENAIMSKKYLTNYILCIDSLTLKFEGLLRDFAKRNKINTVQPRRETGNKEMTIEDLLRSKKMREVLDEDDVILFEYVFTKKGMNLRNNVAHSFFRYDDYSMSYMFTLIACILRIGKYDLMIK